MFWGFRVQGFRGFSLGSMVSGFGFRGLGLASDPPAFRTQHVRNGGSLRRLFSRDYYDCDLTAYST